MKNNARALIILSAFILCFLFVDCSKEHEELDTTPPKIFSFSYNIGDRSVSFNWSWYDESEGVEITYYHNGIKKVVQEYGVDEKVITNLTNNVTYKFTIVVYDKAGNRSKGFDVYATPNTPFIIISPTSTDEYTVVDSLIKIDVQFNRPADTIPYYPLSDFVILSTDNSDVSFTYYWLEDGEVLSILSKEKIDSFCPTFPCNLYLSFDFIWIGAMSYIGISDTNGVLLDGDQDGWDMGVAILTFDIQ